MSGERSARGGYPSERGAGEGRVAAGPETKPALAERSEALAESRAAPAAGEVSKTERILNLVACLLKERRPVPWREIAGRVVGYDDGSDPKSLERRFERDKSALKEMGVKVIYCPPGQYETEGYLIPRDACFLDKLELLPHESALLNLVSELCLRKGGSSFSADLMSALQKLRFDATNGKPAAPTRAGSAINFPPAEPGDGDAPAKGARAAAKKAAALGELGKRRRGRPPKKAGARADDDDGARATPPPAETAALESSLLDLDLAASLRTDPNLEVLTQALLSNQRVAFTYFSLHSGEKRRRELDPYGIGFSRGAWYVVGHDHLRSKVQNFRLDRIEGQVEAVGAERAFKPPRDFRINKYVEKLPWEMADRPPIEARIEVARDLAFFVEDLVAGEDMEARPDGGALVKLKVSDTAAFVKWVLGHLRHVRILEPQSLRDEFAAALEHLKNLYKT